jgi:hypothetical protein
VTATTFDIVAFLFIVPRVLMIVLISSIYINLLLYSSMMERVYYLGIATLS